MTLIDKRGNNVTGMEIEAKKNKKGNIKMHKSLLKNSREFSNLEKLIRV